MAEPALLRAGTTTGLSLLQGDPLPAGWTPEYRIELHRFRSSDAAGAFAAGLEAAGPRNDLAWTWEPGTSEAANRTVIVARLSEPPGDGPVMIRHDRGDADATAFKASMDRIYEERDRHRETSLERTRPLRDAAALAGRPIHGHGYDWVRIGPATASIGKDGYRVAAADGHEGMDGPRSLYPGATPEGASYDAEEREFTAGPFRDAAGAVAAIALLEAAVKACAKVRADYWHARFMEGMRLTAARRRFMAGAAEGGFTAGYHRGSLKAHAGGQEIGASEIHALKKAGWIAMTGMRGSVTEDGKAVLERGGK